MTGRVVLFSLLYQKARHLCVLAEVEGQARELLLRPLPHMTRCVVLGRPAVAPQ